MDFLDSWLKPDFDIKGHYTKFFHSISDIKAQFCAIVLKNEVCFRCLRHLTPGHNCRFKKCTIEGCEQWHHPVLHVDETPRPDVDYEEFEREREREEQEYKDKEDGEGKGGEN